MTNNTRIRRALLVALVSGMALLAGMLNITPAYAHTQMRIVGGQVIGGGCEGYSGLTTCQDADGPVTDGNLVFTNLDLTSYTFEIVSDTSRTFTVNAYTPGVPSGQTWCVGGWAATNTTYTFWAQSDHNVRGKFNTSNSLEACS
jgi:hypothetical protein